jgi:putative flippase GtrA
MKGLIIRCIDFFYPPFRKLVTLQTFRYIACGGGNVVLDILMYYLSNHYFLNKQLVSTGRGSVIEIVNTPVGPMGAHIAAFLIAFAVSFPVGFYLNRTVVFSESTVRGRVQLFRYFILVLICIALNYIFIKLFVEQFNIYPTVAKILTTVIVVTFSYISQKRFTFKTAR